MFFGVLGETSKITKVHNLLVIAFDFKDCHYNILIMFTKKKKKKASFTRRASFDVFSCIKLTFAPDWSSSWC